MCFVVRSLTHTNYRKPLMKITEHESTRQMRPNSKTYKVVASEALQALLPPSVPLHHLPVLKFTVTTLSPRSYNVKKHLKGSITDAGTYFQVTTSRKHGNKNGSPQSCIVQRVYTDDDDWDVIETWAIRKAIKNLKLVRGEIGLWARLEGYTKDEEEKDCWAAFVTGQFVLALLETLAEGEVAEEEHNEGEESGEVVYNDEIDIE